MITITIKPGNFPQVKEEYKPFAVKNSKEGKAAQEAVELIKTRLGIIPTSSVPQDAPPETPASSKPSTPAETVKETSKETPEKTVTATSDDEVVDGTPPPVAPTEDGGDLPPG